MHALPEIYVIVGYLAVLMLAGFLFRNLNVDTSDYFRGGCRTVWWLAGASMFVANISARTFTANAGAVYEAGLSIVFVYGGVMAGTLFQYIFLAARFRQTRAITFPEILRDRFGPSVQQLYAYKQVVVFAIIAGFWLWGLAIFVSAVFSLDILLVIVVLGLVVLVYSTTGGSWAVMSTDFLQGVIMVAMTLLLSLLCLIELGGLGSLIESIRLAGLWPDYKLVKDAGEFARNQYSLPWGLAIFGYIVVADANFSGAPRYFVVKDGREAKRTALLSLCLQLLFLPLIVIPPITARLLYSEQVAAAALGKPAEAAYAVSSLELLPPAMIGLMVIAMFASSMSSMDTGINRNAAIVVRDILPALRRLFGKPGTPGKHEMLLNRSISAFFGLCVIGTALYLAASSNEGMFEVVNAFGALVGLPLAIPLFFGMLMKRLPRWTPLASIPAALVPSALALYDSKVRGEPWDYAAQVFWVFTAGLAAVVVARLSWRLCSRRERKCVLRFFRKMNTPVDFESEVGNAIDSSQLNRLGLLSTLVAVFIATTIVFAHSLRDLACILGVAAFIGGIGVILLVKARKASSQRSA